MGQWVSFQEVCAREIRSLVLFWDKGAHSAPAQLSRSPRRCVGQGYWEPVPVRQYTHPTSAASTLGYLVWPLGIMPQLIAGFLGDGMGLWSEPKRRIGLSRAPRHTPFGPG